MISKMTKNNKFDMCKCTTFCDVTVLPGSVWSLVAEVKGRFVKDVICEEYILHSTYHA
jgi:hypothetical protein